MLEAGHEEKRFSLEGSRKGGSAASGLVHHLDDDLPARDPVGGPGRPAHPSLAQKDVSRLISPKKTRPTMGRIQQRKLKVRNPQQFSLCPSGACGTSKKA